MPQGPERTDATRRWRRWGWGRRLATGVLALLSLATLAGVLVYVATVRPDRRSVPYRQAVERLRANTSAQRLLGTPISTGWWVRGHAGADTARLAVPVAGSDRDGVLHVEATRAGSGWIFSRLELAASDAGLRVSLLDSHRQQRRRRDQEDPAFDVPPRYRE